MSSDITDSRFNVADYVDIIRLDNVPVLNRRNRKTFRRQFHSNSSSRIFWRSQPPTAGNKNYRRSFFIGGRSENIHLQTILRPSEILGKSNILLYRNFRLNNFNVENFTFCRTSRNEKYQQHKRQKNFSQQFNLQFCHAKLRRDFRPQQY